MLKLQSFIQAVYPYVKRIFDILVSITALVIFTPLMIVVGLLVRVTSKGPVIFWSERVGHGGKVFKMPKFRTMTVCSNILPRENASKSDISVTHFGNILRKSSLDELPQFWSVLKGDMSLVGPRPLLANDATMKLRHANPEILNVRPGITGLAQVNGRNFITMRNKTRYDLFYAERLCLFLDLKILFKTIKTVLNVKMVK